MRTLENGRSQPLTAERSEAGLLPRSRRITAIVALSLGSSLTVMDGSMINVAIPTLARDLHVQASSAVLIVTVYQLVMMAALMPFSALSQRWGYRATYQMGLMTFIVSSTLCFFAGSLPFLLVVRGFQALGAAAVLSVTSAMIRSIYPPSQFGRGLSINGVIGSISAAIAPTLGGAILAVAPWSWLFAAMVPFGILSLLIGRKSLPEGVRRNDPFDAPGAVLCIAMFLLVIAGLESAVHGDSPVISAALVALGILVGYYFVRWERSQLRPILPVDLLRFRPIALSCSALLFAYVSMMVLSVTLPFLLQQKFHFSPAAAGAAIAPMALVMMLTVPLSGALSDRYPAGLLGAIGMAISVAGMTAVAFLPAVPEQLDIAWRTALCGLGFSLFFSPNSRHVIGSAPLERAAAAGGLTQTIRGVGQTLGSTSVAALLAGGFGNSPVPPLIAAGLALLAGICCLSALIPARMR
jgi:MFS transporter, DHA2 family, multidrug resistance protein